MPMWRCPHCATPQAETARCWVCHKSTTACGSCRNFRLAVAGQLGYCGLDRKREPLHGDEIRPCWEAADAATTTLPALPGVGPVWPLEPGEDRTAVREIRFVEVEPNPVREGRVAQPSPPAAPAPEALSDPGYPTVAIESEARWSLWGEAEA